MCVLTPYNCLILCTASTATTTKPNEVPQRVQILRGPDGRLTVKGLMPGQQLVQMPDGKLQVLTTTQIQPSTPPVTATTKTQAITPNKTVIKTTANASTGKVVMQGSQVKAILQQPAQSPVKGQHVIIKQQTSTPVVQKIAAAATTTNVVVSGNQVFPQHQVVVSGNQVIGATTGQQVRFILTFLTVYVIVKLTIFVSIILACNKSNRRE